MNIAVVGTGYGVLDPTVAHAEARVNDPRIDITSDLPAAAWDSYVGGHPDATCDHLSGWQAVFERVFGHQTVYLAAVRDGGVAGVLPLVLFRSRLFGRSVISLPFLNYGGILASDSAAAHALLTRATEVARTFDATHVELRHRTRQLPALPCRQHKLALVRQLPATVDELWKGTDRKVRNQVRKAQKESLTAAEGGTELVDEFYAVFAHNMRDLGTPVYSKRLFEHTLNAFPAAARVFVARSGAQPVAAAVAIRFRDTVLVPWASSLRGFRQQCPNMLLYWTMLERATLEGARRFDFGRSSAGGGTHQFKLQWGAEAAPLHWEYALLTRSCAPDQGPTNPRFAAAIQLWKRLPVRLTNATGPLIARHLP